MADVPLPRRDLLKTLALAPVAGALPNSRRSVLPRVDEVARELIDLDLEPAFERMNELRRAGLPPREALGAILLAGVHEIQPRPVGFKLHAVMMVASAHDVVQRSPTGERWLPVFWNLADLKRAQARDEQEGAWQLGPAPAADPVADAAAALQAAVDPTDADPAAVDRACVAAFAAGDADAAFEALWPRAAGDYHNLGHKVIHAAQCRRALDHLGWMHGEPVLRAVAYALIAPGDERARATATPVAAAAAKLRADWQVGPSDPTAAVAVLRQLRPLDAEGAIAALAKTIGAGASAATLWDAMRLRACELLLNRPSLLAVHPLTALNAFRTVARRSGCEATRRAALLQCGAWLGNYRRDLRVGDGDQHIDELTAQPSEDPPAAVLARAAEDRPAAIREALHHATSPAGRAALAEASRAVLVRKAREHHDFKFAAAVFAEVDAAAPQIAPRLLAAAFSYLRHSGEQDSGDAARALRLLAG